MRKAKGDERALWRHATRDVEPLHAEEAPAVALPEQASSATLPPKRGSDEPRRGARVGAASAPNPGLDRRTAQRLKRGQMPIEARLDLHGMTQAEAHAALARFVATSHAAGLRLVIVITGKSGVLHGAVPRWLADGDNRARILATARAQAQHGGAGALYLLLRRQR